MYRIRRQTHRRLVQAVQVRRYAVQSNATSGRSSKTTAGVIFGSILVASVIASRWTSSEEKRKAAILKLDTSRASRQTPGAVTAKADEAIEEEEQSAYDPVTGEINWDCPCLGGMAQGPCGEEFKAAFSCFVHSTEDPKGVDCLEQFKSMQECFRQFPEHYAKEIADDDAAEEALTQEESSSDLVTDAKSALSSAGSKASDLVSEAGSKISDAASSVSSLLSDSSDSHKIQNQGPTQKAYSHHDTTPHTANFTERAGSPNRTAGKEDHLGRNVAKGSRPSGSNEASHQQHLEGVAKTRTGDAQPNSRETSTGMRG